MQNVLQQIIQLYPSDNIVVSMGSGNNASGRPSLLLPAQAPGLLQLANNQGVPQEAVSLCRIAAVRITSATYNNNITYLPEPTPTPAGCAAQCEAAVRSYLPVGTTGVGINAGGQTLLMVTHSVKAASHAGRVLFLRDGEVYHQLYRGEMSFEQMFAKVSDTLTMLTTGGERHA